MFDAEPGDWQRMLDALRSVPWPAVFTWALSEPAADGAMLTARELWGRLEGDPEDSVSLAVQVRGIWFTCYFFDADEIEFSFDPADVVDMESFAPVCDFVRWLGDSTRREVIVTMEGNDHSAMPWLLHYSGVPDRSKEPNLD
ncbi:hypothetical protein [Streptomyces sp. NPDC058297]|uniref:hypothetical protein n=1 Tax=Streptomyces sp. NPDC058297 TaxID=3346433 RepID=UPI0036E6AC71